VHIVSYVFINICLLVCRLLPALLESFPINLANIALIEIQSQFGMP
jgi:hypothetical protein